MSRLEEIGEQDGWRCWLCDEPVDADRSVNDARGPSVDSLSASGKQGGAKQSGGKHTGGKQSGGKQGGGEQSGGKQGGGERLAHRACNTKKGAVAPVIAWPARLFVSDPAPLFAVSQRLQRKGGREVVARCPTRSDALETGDWLVDRFSRLVPELEVTAAIEPGGGQFLVALISPGL